MRDTNKLAAHLIDIYEQLGWTPTSLFRKGVLKDGTTVGCMVGAIAGFMGADKPCSARADYLIADFLDIEPDHVQLAAMGFDSGIDNNDHVPGFIERMNESQKAVFIQGRGVGTLIREWLDHKDSTVTELRQEMHSVEEALQKTA